MRSRSTRPRAMSVSDASSEEPLVRRVQEVNVMLDENRSNDLLGDTPNAQPGSPKPVSRIARYGAALIAATSLVSVGLSGAAMAQTSKPNILFIVSDDTGYGDLGPYGGGEGRGMPTPNIDKKIGRASCRERV